MRKDKKKCFESNQNYKAFKAHKMKEKKLYKFQKREEKTQKKKLDAIKKRDAQWIQIESEKISINESKPCCIL